MIKIVATMPIYILLHEQVSVLCSVVAIIYHRHKKFGLSFHCTRSNAFMFSLSVFYEVYRSQQNAFIILHFVGSLFNV